MKLDPLLLLEDAAMYCILGLVEAQNGDVSWIGLNHRDQLVYGDDCSFLALKARKCRRTLAALSLWDDTVSHQ